MTPKQVKTKGPDVIVNASQRLKGEGEKHGKQICHDEDKKRQKKMLIKWQEEPVATAATAIAGDSE